MKLYLAISTSLGEGVLDNLPSQSSVVEDPDGDEEESLVVEDGKDDLELAFKVTNKDLGFPVITVEKWSP